MLAADAAPKAIDDLSVFEGGRPSLKGQWWRHAASRQSAFALNLAEGLAQKLDISLWLAEILVARGYHSFEAAESFLDPTLRRHMTDPSKLLDMDAAVARCAKAIEQAERIGIFADYDVDGATSAALLLRVLRPLMPAPILYVPDRIAEGYGPNAAAFQKIADEGVRLIILVDCGTLAFTALQAAQEFGLEIIVLDHHQADVMLPPALAVVNPNRLDEKSDLRHLAAAGIVFLFLVGLVRYLRLRGFWGASRIEPDLRALLDLVALGSVCDVVSLQGLNRAYVAQGLKILQNQPQTGLAVLAKVAGFEKTLDVYALGFVLGPRINAGGRVGQSNLGARLLAEDDVEVATEIALQLESLNAQRQQLEAEILQAAAAQAEEQADQPFLLVCADGWHPGILGIIAARLKELHHKPTIVVGFDAAGLGKGSGRSTLGFNIGAAAMAAQQLGHIVAGGGHAMACGVTLHKAQWDAFVHFMQMRFVAEAAQPSAKSLDIDALMTLPAIDDAFMQMLQRLAPFGAGNAEPRFVLVDCAARYAQVLGGKHIRCSLQQGRASLSAIAFRAVGSPLGEALLAKKPLHLAGHIRQEIWQGRRRLQFFIEDGMEVS